MKRPMLIREVIGLSIRQSIFYFVSAFSLGMLFVNVILAVSSSRTFFYALFFIFLTFLLLGLRDTYHMVLTTWKLE
jgi:hypothetical protein